MSALDATILTGSDSDLPALEDAIALFKKFGVRYEVHALSAHRSPEELHRCVRDAESRGVGVFLAAAGGAAHLPGVVASLTVVPVVGIPILTSSFQGIDSLLSILQMPAGVPVATMAVGKSGAKNAAVFACSVLALRDPALRAKMETFKKEQAAEVVAKDQALQKKILGG